MGDGIAKEHGRLKVIVRWSGWSYRSYYVAEHVDRILDNDHALIMAQKKEIQGLKQSLNKARQKL